MNTKKIFILLPLMVHIFSMYAQEYNGHEYIDLGLPSGTLWATCNVNASAPEEYGAYFAWGETEEKTVYDWSTYQYCNGSSKTLTKYCTNSSYGTIDNILTLESSDDAAHVHWGGEWRMPTHAEQQELCDCCTWSWSRLNGKSGYWVVGHNGDSIFLPATGGLYETTLYSAGGYGVYWSSSLHDTYSYRAWYTYFSKGTIDPEYAGHYRDCGRAVRPVISAETISISTNTKDVSHSTIPHKVLHGTRLYIRLGNQTYDLFGREIKK